MNIDETLAYFRRKERKAGDLLFDAVWKNDRENIDLLRAEHAFYLPTVNAKARIKWGTLLIRELFAYFKVPENASDPEIPVFFVTLADKSLITTAEPQAIDIELFKRKLGGRLRGLNYIGMIEPAFYHNAFDIMSQQTPPLVSWHGHFLIWGIRRKRLSRIIRKLNSKLEAVMPDFAAAHWKQVERGKFGKKICYVAKSPCKEYSVGKYAEAGKEGEPRYKHNSREIRPGTRVKLFHLMEPLYFDQLTMAGGDGVEILNRMKFGGLQRYRRRHGWTERRL